MQIANSSKHFRLSPSLTSQQTQLSHPQADGKGAGTPKPNDTLISTSNLHGQDPTPLHDRPVKVIHEGEKRPIQESALIHRTDLKPALNILEDIGSGKTSIVINESRNAIAKFLGFKAKGFKQAIMADLSLLMRSPYGRQLVQEVALHPQPVHVFPCRSLSGGALKPIRSTGARRTGSKPGSGSGCRVTIQEGLTDTSLVVYDNPVKRGQPISLTNCQLPSKNDEIPQPRFMILGHELVHAHRCQRGMMAPKCFWRRDNYHTQEEFETIAGDYAFTENKLRRSFGMPYRFGHFHHKK